MHHPGKLMHLFRGQNLAYFYLAILAEAAQEVQQLVCPRPEVAAAAVQTAQVAANVPSVDVAVAQQKQGSARSLAEDAGNGIQQLEKPELSSDSNSDSPKSEIRKSEARIDLLAGKWGRGRVYPRSASVVRALVDRARNSRNLAAPSAASVNADTSLPLRPAKSAMSATSVYQAIAGVLNMSLPVVPAGVLHSAQPASGIISTKALYRFVREYVHQIQAAPLPPVPNHYNISEIAHEPLCHTNYEPRMKNALTDIIIPAHSNWTYDLSFLDKAAVEKSIAKGYGYIDRKNIFTSSGVNSTLTLRVRNDVPARLWLCEVPKGFAVYPSWAADLVDGADVYIRYNYTPSAAASAGPTSTTQGGNGTLPSQVYIPPDLSKMEKIGMIQDVSVLYYFLLIYLVL